MKKLIFVSALIVVAIISYITYKVISIDNSGFTNISIENNAGAKINNLVLDLNLATIDPQDIYDQFPYSDYIKRVGYFDTSAIQMHLRSLEGLTNNSFLAQSVLTKAYTSELEAALSTNNFDSLNALINYADDYNKIGSQSSNYGRIYSSIGNHWYNYVSNKLSEIAKNKPDSKYSFKFRYLDQRCFEKKYFIDKGNTKVEKVFLYAIDGKWTYILKRFLFAASWKTKTAVILFGLMFIIAGLFCVSKMKKNV